MKRKITLLALLIIFALNAFSQPTLQWVRQLGGTGADFGFAIAVDDSGNVYTTGDFATPADFDPGPGNYYLSASISPSTFISKLDASGNFIWAKAFRGTTGSVDGLAITIEKNRNIYISGHLLYGTVDFDPGPGNFYLTSTAYFDAFVCKLDSHGDFLWAKRYGGSHDDSALSTAIDNNGNVYTTGTFADTVDFDPGPGIYNLISPTGNEVFISKLDSNGNFIWAKQIVSYGGSGYGEGWSIKLDRNNNIFISGYCMDTTDFDPGPGTFYSFNSGAFILKLDSSGSFVWVKQFIGINGYAENYSLSIDLENNIYTSGIFGGIVDFDPGPGTFNLTHLTNLGDIFISKLDSLGNFIWAKQVGGNSIDICHDLAIDQYGNSYITGRFYDTADFDPGPNTFNLIASPGQYSAFICKLDSAGNFVWAGQMAGAEGYAITIDSLRNIYCTGDFADSTDFDTGLGTNFLYSFGSWDAYVMKLSQSPVGILEHFSNTKFVIFPNPATSEVTLKFGKEGRYDVQLCNTLGEILFQTTTSAEKMKIDVRDFPKGIYFVSVRDEENGLVVRKIVKM